MAQPPPSQGIKGNWGPYPQAPQLSGGGGGGLILPSNLQVLNAIAQVNNNLIHPPMMSDCESNYLTATPVDYLVQAGIAGGSGSDPSTISVTTNATANSPSQVALLGAPSLIPNAKRVSWANFARSRLDLWSGNRFGSLLGMQCSNGIALFTGINSDISSTFLSTWIVLAGPPYTVLGNPAILNVTLADIIGGMFDWFNIWDTLNVTTYLGDTRKQQPFIPVGVMEDGNEIPELPATPILLVDSTTTDTTSISCDYFGGTTVLAP